MRYYFQSTVDMSELRYMTDKSIQNEAIDLLQERGLLSSKEKPVPEEIKKAAEQISAPFLRNLSRVMARRGGLEPIHGLFLDLYNSKEYKGFFLMLAFKYGLMRWQVPKTIVALPASPDALKQFESDFLVSMADFILNEKTAQDNQIEMSEAGPESGRPDDQA